VPIGAAPGSDSRIDLIVARVRDAAVTGGVSSDWVIEAIPGAVAASPVAPAVPNTAIPLAQVLVAAGTASITAGMITDRRTAAGNTAYAPRLYRGVHVGLAAAQSIAANTLTLVQWTAETWDQGGPWHDTATNSHRITVPAGVPLCHLAVSGAIQLMGTSGTYRELLLRKNGAIFAVFNLPPGSFARLPFATEFTAVAGDIIEVSVRHDASTALDLGTDTHLALHRIGDRA
jgi:hypothetical protein